MWIIELATLNGSPSPNITVSDGKPINSVRGPVGSSYRVLVVGVGYLDLIDIGHIDSGPHYWAISVFEQTYWYGWGRVTVNFYF